MGSVPLKPFWLKSRPCKDVIANRASTAAGGKVPESALRKLTFTTSFPSLHCVCAAKLTCGGCFHSQTSAHTLDHTLAQGTLGLLDSEASQANENLLRG